MDKTSKIFTLEKTFDFGDNGVVAVKPYFGISGNWNAGLGKKPSKLYISGFSEPIYFPFNDDWTVMTISKTTIRLESENGSNLNKITFTKVEE